VLKIVFSQGILPATVLPDFQRYWTEFELSDYLGYFWGIQSISS